MSALAAGDVENSRAHRELENVDQPGDVAPILPGREERLVLEQVMGVEV